MKPGISRIGSGLMAAAAAVVLSLPTGASAFDLKGKDVTWIVPFKEGGGSDTIARLMQPFLQKALPGNPTILVLNQPGGGSVTATNKFHRSARKDGTELIIASTSTFVPVTLGASKVKYDPTEWRALMGLPRGTVLYTNPKITGAMGAGKNPVADIQALRTQDLSIGLKNPTSAELLDLITLELLEVPVKPVFGLSTSKGRKAFLRGETNLNSDGTGPYLKHISKVQEKGEATPLYAYGYQTTDGRIARDPDLIDVPTAVEVLEAVHGKTPSGAGFEAMKNMLNNKVSLSKIIALPQGTPDEIYDVYLAAFKEISRNPELAAGLKKSVGSLPVTFGEDTAAVLKAGTKMSPEARKWVQDFLERRYDASL